MGKKYSPSGYQIIDLGEIDLGSEVTINKGDNADADVLIDKYTTAIYNGEIVKPVLLRFYDRDDGLVICGFVSIIGDYLTINDASYYYQVLLTTDNIKISKTGI